MTKNGWKLWFSSSWLFYMLFDWIPTWLNHSTEKISVLYARCRHCENLVTVMIIGGFTTCQCLSRSSWCIFASPLAYLYNSFMMFRCSRKKRVPLDIRYITYEWHTSIAVNFASKLFLKVWIAVTVWLRELFNDSLCISNSMHMSFHFYLKMTQVLQIFEYLWNFVELTIWGELAFRNCKQNNWFCFSCTTIFDFYSIVKYSLLICTTKMLNVGFTSFLLDTVADTRHFL